MSTLLWFILIFIYFMHRGRGYSSMGGCDGGHTHWPSDDRMSSGRYSQEQNSSSHFADIQEAEYIEIKEEQKN